VLQVSWLDVVAVILVFWLPAAALWSSLVLREVGRLRREMRRLKAEMEADAAEGFPPPDPPTTDSLS
jgi:hypothetical protein